MGQKEILKNTTAGQEKIRRFFTAVLKANQVDQEAARYLIEGLLQTSLRGVDSHGIRLFPHYIRALQAGRINGNPVYEFTQTAAATGVLNADHTFGHAAGARAMQEAIKLAQKSGISAVGVCNSTHFGAAAYYGLMAAEKDMIGISMTHADALMLTSGGKRAFFGTNPVCIAAPIYGESPFCLDMATSKITWNKVKMHRETGEPLADNVAADEQGVITTNAGNARSILPIGDYKGFGLSMAIDMFCALLTGAPFGREIKAMFTTPIAEKRFLGQFYMVIDISKFVDADKFKRRLKEYVDEIRREPASCPGQEIMVAGDPEKKCYQKRIKSGIPLTEKEVEEFFQLKESHNIKERFL